MNNFQLIQEYKINSIKLEDALKMFKEYANDPKFKEDIKERYEREKFFKDVFNEEFNELVFLEIIKKLWASQIWGNKNYLVDKIIKDNGITKIRDELKSLVFSKKTPGERYLKFLDNIKGIGPSMITEILCHSDPKNAGIWNERARNALAWLEVKGIPASKYKINDKEYNEFNKFLKKFLKLFEKQVYGEIDLLFLDYFLWEVWERFIGTKKIDKIIPSEKIKGISKHDELRDKVSEIGSWLGFDVESEKLIATGSKVDVIWKAKIANLGAVTYVFEVQDKGSVDSLIVNLQQAQTNPTVQKLIIVSNSFQIERIKKKINTLPENFRKAITYWDAEIVENTHQNLEQVSMAIAKLRLIDQ